MQRFLWAAAAVLVGCSGDDGTPPVTQRDFAFYIPPGSAQYWPADNGRCIGGGEFQLWSDNRFREIRHYRSCGGVTPMGADTVTGRRVADPSSDYGTPHRFDHEVARADASILQQEGALEIIHLRTRYDEFGAGSPGVNIQYARTLP